MKKTCRNCKHDSGDTHELCVPFLNKKCHNPEIVHSMLSGECWEPKEKNDCGTCLHYKREGKVGVWKCCNPVSCIDYCKWEPEKNDNVNHPSHYKQYETETINIIKSCLTHEQYKGYLLGNMLKYRLRAGWKGDRDEDLKKSNVYQDWLKGEDE